MPVIKRLAGHPKAQGAISFLLACYIRFVYATSRRELHFHPEARPYAEGGANAIFAFWHGRMLLFPALYRLKRPARVLISQHRDGRMIARVIGHFNLQTISGSTSRGGKEAVAEILKALQQGDNVAITPDGPRGPAQVAAKGVAAIARLSGKPVIPVAFAASRAKTMRSWDRFLLALPFGRIVFCAGRPMMFAGTSEDDDEAARLEVEQAMNALVEQAQARLHG